MKPILYLRLKKKIQAQPGQLLKIQDVCQLVVDESFLSVKEIPVYSVSLENGNYTVIESIDLISLIHQQYPDLEIHVLGPAQTIVEVKSLSRIPSKLLVFFVWILLFIGSGLAIMNFHTDVSMKEVHERIYFQLTGEHVKKPLILQIPYSFGIGVGMVLFFNHLFKRRFNEEPSPMELEMFLYQETIDQYLINDEKQKKNDPLH